MQTEKSPSYSGYVTLGLGILAIGISPVLLRMAQAPGPVAGFYRMGIAVFILAIPFFIRVKKLGKLPPRGVLITLLAGFFFGLDMTSWTTGVMMSGATMPTLLANTTPVWVGLGAMLFYKEKLDAKFWGGLLVALVGAVVVLGVDFKDLANLDLGAFYGLLAAVFYGSYFLSSQNGREKLDPLTFTWISITTSTLVLLVFTQILGQPLTGYSSRTYAIFIAMAVLVQVVGWYLISHAQGYLPASIVSPTMLGQPILSAILAWILLEERFSEVQFLGGIAVLAGVFIVHRSRNNHG
jgi:drug/metabolite transporter (DMT)-like permease